MPQALEAGSQARKNPPNSRTIICRLRPFAGRDRSERPLEDLFEALFDPGGDLVADRAFAEALHERLEEALNNQ